VRPTLKPGAAVLRRDTEHLQVGTSPGVVIHDRPGLYPFLRGLDGTRDLATLRRQAARDHPDLVGDIADILAPLVAAGAVIDAPDVAPPRLRIAVRHDLPTTAFAHHLATLATAVNLELGPEPDLTVMISSGEPARIPVADATSVGHAHLIVTLAGEEVRIGPFVVPGRSPCLGCLDLHRASWDPCWSALIPQFGPAQRNTLSALTEPAAAAEVAAQCLQFGRGGMPRSAAEIVTIGSDRVPRSLAPSQFHPRCGCALLSAA
jgi:hypothetical protein